MFSPRALSRFLSPWLAYAALSGVCAGFCFGGVITLFGSLGGLFTLLGGAADGTFLKAATEVAKAFPEYAKIVLFASAIGFVGGFATGLISSLVGGQAGYWWSFVATFGVLCLALRFSSGHRGLELMLPPLALGAFGAVFPNQLLISRGGAEWEQTLSRWLKGTWLASPPNGARRVGLLLPLLLGITIEVWTTAPHYLANKSYVARLGIWATWTNSRRAARANPYPRTTSCQSNLKQIMLGVMQYTQDYDHLYPPKPVAAQYGVVVAIYPYVRAPQLFQCPAQFYSPEELFSSNPLRFRNGDYTDYWFNARFWNKNGH